MTVLMLVVGIGLELLGFAYAVRSEFLIRQDKQIIAKRSLLRREEFYTPPGWKYYKRAGAFLLLGFICCVAWVVLFAPTK